MYNSGLKLSAEERASAARPCWARLNQLLGTDKDSKVCLLRLEVMVLGMKESESGLV